MLVYDGRAHRDLMADNTPPDIPTWAAILGTLVTAIAGFKAWGPVGRWIGRRIETAQQIRAAERGDVIANLRMDLATSREENISLRHELGEERELRMSFTADYAALKAEVEWLKAALGEEKRDCRREILALKREIGELKRQRSVDHP